MRSVPRRPWLLLLAIVSLVWLQTLGAMHGIVHVPGHARGTALVGEAKATSNDVLARLFHGHDRDGDCQLFDQIAHADLATLPVIDLPLASFEAVLQTAEPATWLAARLRAFRARDPPFLA